MAKKIGVYLPGLGEEHRNETGIKYAQRLLNQLNFDNNNSSATYEIKIEKIKFDEKDELYTNEISIIEKLNSKASEVYKIYEFQYKKILTEAFEKQNVLVKSFTLFISSIVKLPVIFLRLFRISSSIGYSRRHRGETLFIFGLFILMSLAILFLLPSAIGLIITAFGKNEDLKSMINYLHINPAKLKTVSQVILNITAAILVIIPAANTLITSLATEFICASNYLNAGERKQKVHGQLDKLIEFIVEREGADVELTLHSYSFGSIISLDFIFPFGIEPSQRILNNVKGLITIGCPFDFVSVYYPNFFDNRKMDLIKKIKWLNVYSIQDALASNFRKTPTVGVAEYSFAGVDAKPINLNYEVSNTQSNLLVQVITLSSIKAHTCYWDKEDDGQSCLRIIVKEMKTQQLI